MSTKTYLVGTHEKRLAKALLMSTHNICFHEEIRKKTLIWILILSGAVNLQNISLLVNCSLYPGPVEPGHAQPLQTV